MKTDKNFRLSKSAKRMLASIDDKNERRLFKEAFIEAESLDAPRFVMNYDIGSNGKAPRRVREATE